MKNRFTKKVIEMKRRNLKIFHNHLIKNQSIIGLQIQLCLFFLTSSHVNLQLVC